MSMHWRCPADVRLAAVGTLVTLLVACAGAVGPTPLVFNEPLPVDPGPDRSGRALQTEIFADGVVTASEYERAMRAAVECMRAQGFDVEGPLRYPDGPLAVEPGLDPTIRLSVRARVRSDPADRYGEVNATCQAQWSYAVEQIYLRQFQPTEAEVQAWLDRAWSCAREKGMSISSPPTEEDASQAVLQGCRPWEH
jgi:hypothetical protein